MKWTKQEEDAPENAPEQGWDGHSFWTVRQGPSGKWLALCNSRGKFMLGKFDTKVEAMEVCENHSAVLLEMDETIDLV